MLHRYDVDCDFVTDGVKDRDSIQDTKHIKKINDNCAQPPATTYIYHCRDITLIHHNVTITCFC